MAERLKQARSGESIKLGSRRKNLLDLPDEILQQILNECVERWDIFLWAEDGYWSRACPTPFIKSAKTLTSLKHPKLDAMATEALDAKFSGTLLIRGGGFCTHNPMLPQFVVNRKDKIIRIVYRTPNDISWMPLSFNDCENLREIVLVDRNFHKTFGPYHRFDYDETLNGALDEDIKQYIAQRRCGNRPGWAFWKRFEPGTPMPAKISRVQGQQQDNNNKHKSVIAVIEIPGRELIGDGRFLDTAKVCITSRLNTIDSTPFEWAIKFDPAYEDYQYPFDGDLTEGLPSYDFEARNYISRRMACIRRQEDLRIWKRQMRSNATTDSMLSFELGETFLALSH